MRLAPICLALLLAPGIAAAGTKISGTNSYVLRERYFMLDKGGYWTQDNFGSYKVSEGPLDDGEVECLGAGHGDMSGVSGGGICVFTSGTSSFTWEWEAHHDGSPNTWRVVGATGKYKGMRGSGTATTRIESEYHAMRLRTTDWEGEITLPE